MITLQEVSKGFTLKEGLFSAVHPVSLQILEGDIHGIVGSSGAGKSTLLRLMNILEKPDTGHVFIAGQDLTTLSENQLREARKSIGMIFQQFNLINNKSVSENVAVPLELARIPKKQRKKRVEECLLYVGLQDKSNQYPGQLSGGQKQRVAIARALANNPKVLLCDEPTSSLDPQTTGEVLHVLKQINKDLGVTIVIVTHEMEVVKSICNKVSVMEDGYLVETFETEPSGFMAPQNDSKWYIQQLKSKVGNP